MKKNYAFFAICSLFVLVSCSKTVENCKIAPDYEKIGDEALNSMDDMRRINLMQMKAACNF